MRRSAGSCRRLPIGLTAHVRRYHGHYRSSGHVLQGRFKAFPIQHDDHLLTVLRYIERNPLHAGLVARAEDWLCRIDRIRPNDTCIHMSFYPFSLAFPGPNMLLRYSRHSTSFAAPR